MDPQKLAAYCRELGLKNIEASYYGKFSIWLENHGEQSGFTKAFLKTLWFAGKIVTKIVPVESKRLSPYIVVKAIK
jgi:hypothetical protein